MDITVGERPEVPKGGVWWVQHWGGRPDCKGGLFSVHSSWERREALPQGRGSHK